MAQQDQALFGRRCRLTIAYPVSSSGNYSDVVQTNVLTIGGEGDPLVPGMQIKFHVCKSREKEPNKADITISNLSESTRRSLQTKGVKLLLEAGYVDTGVTSIFSGDARSIDHVRKVATWETIIKCGDGARSFSYARVAESFGPNTTAGQILRTLAASTGLRLGNSAAAVASLDAFRFQHGYTVTGSAQRALDALLKGLGYTWSIQGGALQILRPGQVLDLSIPLISESTGLIGSPEMGSPEVKGKPALCKFKSMLIATVPGAVVHLKSDRYDSDVVVDKCEMDGDTGGHEWDTTIYGILRT